MHNALTTNLKSNIKLIADDISLFTEVCDPLETAKIRKIPVAVVQRCFLKKAFLKISQIHSKTPAPESLFFSLFFFECP